MRDIKDIHVSFVFTVTIFNWASDVVPLNKNIND